MRASEWLSALIPSRKVMEEDTAAWALLGTTLRVPLAAELSLSAH